MLGSLAASVGPLGPLAVLGGRPASPLLTGLEHFWSLNESSGTRYDVIGTAHLADNNTVGSAAKGAGAPANMPDTVASFITANAENLTTTAQIARVTDYFVNFWVKVPDYTATEGFLAIGDANSYYQTHNPAVWIQSSALWVAIGDGYPVGNHYKTAYITPYPTNGGWHMISMKYTQSSQKAGISIDGGAWTETASLGYNPIINSLTTRLGSWGQGNFLTGQISGCGYWSRIPTSDEQIELYASGAGKFWPF